MNDQASARAAENGSAGEHLSAERGRFSIAGQAGGTLKFGEQVEHQQHGPKRCFGSEEFLHAKSVCGAQIMLQLGDAILGIGSPIVIAPDLLSSLPLTGHEDTERITGNVNQFATHTVARFAHAFPYRDEASLYLPRAEA